MMNEYQEAIQELIDAMEMQLMREAELLHCPANTANAIWKKAIQQGRLLLPKECQDSLHATRCTNCNTKLDPIDQTICTICQCAFISGEMIYTAGRKEALQELSNLNQEMGLYEDKS